MPQYRYGVLLDKLEIVLGDEATLLRFGRTEEAARLNRDARHLVKQANERRKKILYELTTGEEREATAD